MATIDRGKVQFEDGRNFDVINSAIISSGKYTAYVFAEGTLSCSLKVSR
jgi:hypothetical protein